MSLLDDASLLVTPNARKEGKLYSIIPTNGNGDFSVTRATTATRVNAAGLVELVPYNLFSYSEMFANAYWAKTRSTISANTLTAPNGTLTADKLVEDTSTGTHQVLSTSSSVTTGSNYVSSIYAKAGERNWVLVVYFDGATVRGRYFDLSNGTGGANWPGTPVTNSITSVGNGWYRITLSYTATSTTNILGVYLANADGSASYTGNGTSGIYIWGAQLVEGTSALDYQMTETRLNIPRLDYSLGSCPNILLEPQRTNLGLQSEDLSSASWLKGTGVTITTDNTISPSGVQNADRVSGATGTGTWASANTVGSSTSSLLSNTLYTATIYLRSSTTSSQVTFRLRDQSTGLENQIVCNLTSSWQRFELSRTTGAATTALAVILTTATADFFAWGRQLEAGAYATSYIPTTSASVTRNADVISNTSATSLIGQTEGTIFVDFDNLLQTSYANEYLFSLFGNSSNQVWIRKETGANTYTARVLANGSTAVTILAIPVLNGRNKIALAYKSGQTALYLNGSLVANDADAYTFNAALTRIDLASLNGSANGLSKIYAAALFPTRLTNTQLAALTA